MRTQYGIFFSLFILSTLMVKCQPTGLKSHDFFQQQQELIKKFTRNTGTKGISMALFTADSVVWEYSYGKSTYGYKVDNKTLFSIQSASKNITALAVLIAVQEGLLELDRPIFNYLPGFRVSSCFEENPENKITLRMLLSHTAGFTHEAPVGNNYDYNFSSVDDHIKSIERTWLKYPAGAKYSYSNLGFDLAARIVEKVSGMPFSEYLKKKIFLPLSMNSTTISDYDFLSTPNKTEGHIYATRVKHYKIPLLGSGAVYSSVDDLVKYIQFQLKFGNANGIQLLKRELLKEMYTIVSDNYGLGTYIGEDNGSFYLNHNGGGFGFGSSLVWYPEFGLGCVVLANNPVNCFEVASGILQNSISYKKVIRRDTIVTNGLNPFRKNQQSQKLADGFNMQCECDSTFKTEWNKYLGKYEVLQRGLDFKWYARLSFAFGYKPLKVSFERSGDSMFMKGSFGENKLREYKSGLFFTESGEAVDFSSSTPTYRNITLRKYK